MIVGPLTDGIKVVAQCPESDFFNSVELALAVDVVKHVLIVHVLLIPFEFVIVAEIITDKSQNNVVFGQRTRLCILLEQQLCSCLDVDLCDGYCVEREFCQTDQCTITMRQPATQVKIGYSNVF